ncbi:hypothetical protein GCM10020000_75170 [Streptomyces olivoverticillatus]
MGAHPGAKSASHNLNNVASSLRDSANGCAGFPEARACARGSSRQLSPFTRPAESVSATDESALEFRRPGRTAWSTDDLDIPSQRPSSSARIRTWDECAGAFANRTSAVSRAESGNPARVGSLSSASTAANSRVRIDRLSCKGWPGPDSAVGPATSTTPYGCSVRTRGVGAKVAMEVFAAVACVGGTGWEKAAEGSTEPALVVAAMFGSCDEGSEIWQ